MTRSISLQVTYRGGRPLGLEILSPATVNVEQVWSVFDRLGLDRPTASELSPLSAA